MCGHKLTKRGAYRWAVHVCRAEIVSILPKSTTGRDYENSDSPNEPVICKCAKHSRLFCWWCLTQTMAFPLEHLAWEKAPVLSAVTRYLGL